VFDSTSPGRFSEPKTADLQELRERMKGFEPSTFCMAIGWCDNDIAGFGLQIAQNLAAGHELAIP
jgi:hypothetical protein